MTSTLKQLTLRLPEGLVQEIDAASGDVPRERWIRRAIESYLASPAGRSHPGPNVENVRSSSQAKRNVTPIPKGGKS